MRSFSFGAAAVALAIGLSACDRAGTEIGADLAEAAAIEKPPRKAGLWEQTTTIEGQAPQALRLCSDPSVENTLPWWGRVAQVGSCRDQEGKRNPDGSYSFVTQCNMGGAGRSNITGTGSGDFDTGYEVNVTMVTVGASNPQLNGPRKLTNVFKYKGECPADWSLGDVEVPGGMRMNYDPDQVQREIAKAQEQLKKQEVLSRAAAAFEP